MKRIAVISIAVLLFAGLAGAGFWYFAQQETSEQVDRLIAQAIESGAYQDVQYETAEMAVDGSITITGLTITEPDATMYHVDEVLVSDLDLLNPFPHSINITARGFSFPEGIPQYQSSGNAVFDTYIESLLTAESLPLSVNYRHQYNPDDNDRFEGAVNLSLPEAASISMGATSRGIPIEMFNAAGDVEQYQAQMLNIMAVAEIPEASFSVEDLGIIDTYLELMAGSSGRSIDTIRQEHVNMMETLYLFAPPDIQALAINLSQELGRFMEGGMTFNVSIRPDFSGNLQQLQPMIMSAFFSGEYGQVVDLLNLEFSTR